MTDPTIQSLGERMKDWRPFEVFMSFGVHALEGAQILGSKKASEAVLPGEPQKSPGESPQLPKDVAHPELGAF